jgi:hypothetical protein
MRVNDTINFNFRNNCINDTHIAVTQTEEIVADEIVKLIFIQEKQVVSERNFRRF